MMKEQTEGMFALQTEIIQCDEKVAIVKATLSTASGTYTGHALERVGSHFINKTSHLENAETSAIGRCLASAGYTGGGEFCSADELATAVSNQGAKAKVNEKDKPKPLTKRQKDRIAEYYEGLSGDVQATIKKSIADETIHSVNYMNSIARLTQMRSDKKLPPIKPLADSKKSS